MQLDAQATARERLVAELRAHALVIGEVVLTSGATAHYLVDAKRAILRRLQRPVGARRRPGSHLERHRGWRDDDGR